MNIIIEYIFINTELSEIKNPINNTIKDYIEKMVIVNGKDLKIYITFDFLIK